MKRKKSIPPIAKSHAKRKPVAQTELQSPSSAGSKILGKSNPPARGKGKPTTASGKHAASPDRRNDPILHEGSARNSTPNAESKGSEVPSGGGLFNNVITASRMNCAMRCLRQHFWQYEVGLRKNDVALALRFGSAWARGMEARWNELYYEESLMAAIPEGIDLDAYSCSTIAALLAAYYDYYGEREDFGKLHPEVQFKSDLGDGVFSCEGKIDGLGSLADGRSGIIESKTTSDSIAPDSDYWLRLAFDPQTRQYVVESRKLGWDPATVLYDVTRKPSIRPKMVDDLDKDKLRIVVDPQGQRIFKKDGSPRQSPDSEKGYTVKQHYETPDEFADRLYKDAMKRPDFYFARREVPIIDKELDSFENHRWSIARLILNLRASERPAQRDAEAWPRNVSEHTCTFCSYKSFCLNNVSVDLNNPPEGFSVKPFNPELDYATNDASTTSDGSAAAS